MSSEELVYDESDQIEHSLEETSEDLSDKATQMMREEIAKLEEEEMRLNKLVETQSGSTTSASSSSFDPNVAAESDLKSVYIGNVDYSVTKADLEHFFASCGTIVRVTLPEDATRTSHKGYAYIEFKDEDDVINAIALSETDLKGRALSVKPKRTNVANFNRGGRGGRGGRGRGRGRGGMMPGFVTPMYVPMPMMPQMFGFPNAPNPYWNGPQPMQPRGGYSNRGGGRGGRGHGRSRPY